MWANREPLERGQVVAATLILGAAYVPLAGHLAIQVSAFIAVVLVLRLAAVRWPALAPGRLVLLLLTLAGLGIALEAYLSFAGRDAGTALLATMIALKTLELRRRRDLRLLTILFGFLLVSQFLFDQAPGRALYLGLLFIANVALMADLAARHPDRPMRGALRLAGTLTLQALPLALALFVLFPRLSAPLWSLGNLQQRGVMGMSDSMAPGSISELVVSGEPAFRARFDGPAPAPSLMYWRGLVLWGFDGRRWSMAAPGAMPSARPRLARADGTTSYEVVLEPTNQPWLYSLDLPLAAPEGASLDGDFQIRAGQRVTKVTRYRAQSATNFDTGPLDLDQQAAGLQLPDNVTQRMRDLVARWQAIGGDPEGLVERALAHIRSGDYYYTLLPPALGANPADQFFFETRRGYCEHYASAFALLMRVAGIPARVVVGYQGGELSTLGNWYLVSQSDAHAWTEVWLSGRGWVRIDPTAAIAPQRIERGGLLDRLANRAPLRFQLDEEGGLVRLVQGLRRLSATAGLVWQDWVVDFSLGRQEHMLSALGLGHLRQYGLVLAMLVVGAAILGLLTLTLVRGADRREPLERIYQAFCDRLARVGLARGPSEGPADYARRVTAVRPDLADTLNAFIALYLPARYGSDGDRADLRALKVRLHGFRPRPVRAVVPASSPRDDRKR
jgi:protein-glutamine gamma-glutamyltransferase